MNQIYLLDTDFLRKLDLIQHKKVFAKITLLTWDEIPIKEIQGSITSGSINIDGASAVRRSCSLSMVTNDRDISKTYWTLNSKFKLEIGLENNIESKYPNIVWFKQGIYVFTSINMSVTTNNYTINLSGKDKMCLLNGEIGGTIAVSTDFGKIDETKTLETGEIIVETKSLKIVDVIKNMVNVYAEEPWHNIIINNVDEYGFELLEWRSEQPLYMERDTNGNVTQAYVQWQGRWGEQVDWKKQKQAGDAEGTNYFYSLSPLADNNNATLISDNYYLIKVEYGETVGYRITDLTYPGDLIANVGESITSVLDKIKNIFNDFEYFYNVDGQFVFQKKKTYANESYNNIIKQEGQTYIEPIMYSSSSSYSFDNGMLITNFANTPNIANIKNDFSIWGTRKTASGAEVKIHLRKAIDARPERYTTCGWNKEEKKWDDELSKEYSINTIYQGDNNLDWREIIYQMAVDYYKCNQEFEFNARLSEKNSEGYGPKLTKFGLTGYEQYYADIQGFWRQLYHPGVFQGDFITESEKKQMARDILVDEGKLDPSEEDIKNKMTSMEYEDYQDILLKSYNEDGWHKNKTEAPYLLNFWFDFIGERAELAEYSIDIIGHRTKALDENAVAAIEYSQIPSAIFITAEERKDYDSGDYSGYTFIQITDQLKNFFTISSQGISAQNKFESLLYNHIFVQESVTITALPIYYLQPNSRIHVSDKDTGIEGEYLVNKITIPLQYNGTTSITATKVVDRIY